MLNNSLLVKSIWLKPFSVWSHRLNPSCLSALYVLALDSEEPLTAQYQCRLQGLSKWHEGNSCTLLCSLPHVAATPLSGLPSAALKAMKGLFYSGLSPTEVWFHTQTLVIDRYISKNILLKKRNRHSTHFSVRITLNSDLCTMSSCVRTVWLQETYVFGAGLSVTADRSWLHPQPVLLCSPTQVWDRPSSPSTICRASRQQVGGLEPKPSDLCLPTLLLAALGFLLSSLFRCCSFPFVSNHFLPLSFSAPNHH